MIRSKSIILIAILFSALTISCSISSEKLPVIEKAPDFELTNQNEKRIRFSNFQNKVTVMSFIYAKCAMVNRCPLTTKNFRRTQKLLGDKLGQKVMFLTITFDPKSDTPGALKRYAEIYGADFGNWHFLTGTTEEIDKVCADYEIIKERQESGSIRHSLITFLIDQDRNVRKMYFANQWTPKEIKKDIITLLD